MPNVEFACARCGKLILVAATVRVLDLATGAEKWHFTTGGPVRFAPAAQGQRKPATIHDRGAAIRAADQEMADERSLTIVEKVQRAAVDRGYAMVLGDAEGRLSKALAAGTRPRVINVLTEPTAATALRERLIRQTAWYGSRIHVQWSWGVPRKFHDLLDVDGVLYGVVEPGRAEKPGTPRTVHIAGDEKAYLVLGKSCWRDRSDVWVEFDPRTGRQQHVFGAWTPPPAVSIKTPQQWPAVTRRRWCLGAGAMRPPGPCSMLTT